MTELSFDAAIVASTKESIVGATMELNRVVTAFGLTRSGITQDDLIPICIDGDVVVTVSSFCYLGSIVEGHGGVALEVDARIACAVRVFGALQ